MRDDTKNGSVADYINPSVPLERETTGDESAGLRIYRTECSQNVVSCKYTCILFILFITTYVLNDMLLIFLTAFDWKQRQKYHCCELVRSPVCSAVRQSGS